MPPGNPNSGFGSPRIERASTRLIFLLTGFAAAAWASIVPLAKARTGADEATLGFVLLCLGAGSIVSMPVAGAFSARHGCRVVLTTTSLLICGSLPLLAVVSSVSSLAGSLFLFGIGLGSTDCVMNLQGVVVERASGKPLMSGFHGFYSLGGLVGAAASSALLTLGLSALESTLVDVAAIFLALLVAYAGLLPGGDPPAGPSLALPRGVVLFIGTLCFIAFLVEGSMMDWSAVLLTQKQGISSAQSGFGFASFSFAMTFGRLTGDALVARVGRHTAVVGGALLAAVGIGLTVLFARWQLAVLGYGLVGAMLQHSAHSVYRCRAAKDDASGGGHCGDYLDGLRRHSCRPSCYRGHCTSQQFAGSLQPRRPAFGGSGR